MINLVCEKNCTIGEGPVWNEKESKLYFTNGFTKEFCVLDVYTGELEIRKLENGVAAFCFDREGNLIVSAYDGVYYLNDDGSKSYLYDKDKHEILYGNDMKVGPDGRIYVGTQSAKYKGVSDEDDGALYSIDKEGNVKKLLSGMGVSNGLEWSVDEKKFYHTDSCTKIIKEYNFEKESGSICPTGREVRVDGVDGFTTDSKGNLLVACWGYGHIAVVDTESFEICDYIKIPASAPASCGFCGKNMELLAVVTASYNVDLNKEKNAGFTYILKLDRRGRAPYLFGNL